MRFLLSLVILPSLIMSCTKLNSFEGYKTVKTETVEPLSSELVQMVHEKSGASIVLVKNKDQALSFMVGFKTPPYDDTGLFHIFEHAVLEGSRHYPSKSNFFHLANSSVASFINAMTSSVNTFYPFVTRSPQDFDNLLPVYMDAVFFPNVLTDPRIIKREGWRYEVNPDTKKMSINGIVLSEMKGAFSSPYRSLWYQTSKALLPNTPYAFSSGGLPEKVATLTFEQIVEAHKKYYHPQNSVIYLYGDMDFRKALKTIDQDFLSHFTKDENFHSPEIPVQTTFNYETPVVASTYPGDKGEHKDFVTHGYVLGKDLTTVEKNALNVLIDAFINNDASPLKQRIQKEGLAKSAFSMEVGGLDNGMVFVFEGSNQKDLDKVKTVLNEEIEKIVKDGIDPELLHSILNKYEFSFKEKNSNGSHRGLQIAFMTLNNWTFKDQPLKESLDFVTQFKELRKVLENQDYVKSFFKKYFLENNRMRSVVLTPDPDFSHKFNAGLDRQIEQALKEKPIDEYLSEHKKYEEWVAAKEPEEILAKTPTLKLTDIIPDEAPITQNTMTLGDTPLLQYPMDTNGIAYLSLHFDISGVPQDQLKNLNFLQSFVGKVDTQKTPFKDLIKKVDTTIGGFNLSFSTNQSVANPEKFKPQLNVYFSFLMENQKEAFELVSEMLTSTEFTPVDRLDQLIKEMKTGLSSNISSRAPSLSASAATKKFYPQLSSLNDEIGGSQFEKYMQSEILAQTLANQLKTNLGTIFNSKRLQLMTVTASLSDLPNLQESLTRLQNQLPQTATDSQTWDFSKQAHFDSFIIPGEVQYVSEATSFRENMKYDGSMLVYARYLNNNYMTPKLREQAGAYGGGASFSRNGIFTMTTYRDPNLKKSFEIFSQAISFMKNEKLNKEKLLPAILGSLKPYYSDTSLAGKSGFMTSLYLTEQTWQDYLDLKKQILATDEKSIETINQALEKSLQQSQKAVAGNAQKIKNEGKFLKKTLIIK